MHRSIQTCRLLFIAILAALATLGSAQANDADQIKKQSAGLFKIMKEKDWVHLYSVVEFSPAVKKTLTGADSFAKDVAEGIRQSDPEDNFTKVFKNMNGIQVGAVVVEGNHAYAATTCTISMPGQTPVVLLGVASFIHVGSDWKWDLTFTDDAQKATERRLSEMLGQAGTPAP